MDSITINKGTAMKKIIGLLAATMFMAIGVFAQTTWTLDNAHSSVKFSVSHLVISEVEGNFKSFSGVRQTEKPDFSDATVAFSVDVASINTDNDMRDKHLKTDDFFNVEKYPEMMFKSISWKKTDDNNYMLEGDLT